MNFSFTGGAGVMDRVTAPDPTHGTDSTQEAAAEFAFWQAGLLGDYRNYYDNVVNTDTALRYSAVWACVRWIAQTLAMLPWEVFERLERGRQKVDLADNVSWIIGQQANPETTAFEWKQVMLCHALTDGNGYSENELDGFGRLHWTWQLGRGRVCPDRTDSGSLIYEVKNGSGVKNTILQPNQVFHLKGLGDDGLVGYSVIEMARKTIQLGRNEERFGDDFFSRGPTPGGIFMSKTKMTKEAETEARKSFDSLYSGRKNVGRVIRITGDASFTPLSLPNTDAQFLESRRFSVEEICRWYGVPPHKVQHLERSTNNNIEQQAIEAVQDCLLPWASRLQSEADVKFYGRVNRGRRFTEFNFAKLLRGDAASMSEALSKQVTSCITTPNEARDELGKNPVDGGDTLMIQGAMVPLEIALEGPQPPPAAPSEPKPPNDGKPPAAPADIAAAFTRLLADAHGRLFRVEADKARRAANKGRLAAHVAEFYVDKEEAEFAGILMPIFTAFLLAAGRADESADQLATAAAQRHFAWSKRTLIDAGAVPANWGDQAKELAKVELGEAFKCAGLPKPAEPQPQTTNLKVESPTVNVTIPQQPAPVINIAIPEAKPADVRVDVKIPEQPAPVVNTTVNVPEQKPADVRVEPTIHVAAAAPPVVNVTVPKSEPQPAPVVNVQVPPPAPPTVNVAAPAVTVNVPEQKPPDVKVENHVPAAPPPTIINKIETPPDEFDLTIDRDNDGKATGMRKRKKK